MTFTYYTRCLPGVLGACLLHAKPYKVVGRVSEHVIPISLAIAAQFLLSVEATSLNHDSTGTSQLRVVYRHSKEISCVVVVIAVVSTKIAISQDVGI